MQKWSRLSAVALAVALATGGFSARAASTNESPAAAVTPQPGAPAATNSVLTPPVRIKAGATDSIKDSQGNLWLADQGSADGETYEAADAEITNTKDPELYRTERYSMTAYSLAVPNGKYTVKLYFAEVYSGISGPGDRVFSFKVQDHDFKDFDIWAKAGGFGKAYVESVDVDVTDGKLNITFTPKVENPKINAIEILPRA